MQWSLAYEISSTLTRSVAALRVSAGPALGPAAVCLAPIHWGGIRDRPCGTRMGHWFTGCWRLWDSVHNDSTVLPCTVLHCDVCCCVALWLSSGAVAGSVAVRLQPRVAHIGILATSSSRSDGCGSALCRWGDFLVVIQAWVRWCLHVSQVGSNLALGPQNQALLLVSSPPSRQTADNRRHHKQWLGLPACPKHACIAAFLPAPSVCLMKLLVSAGDGLADVVGRRLGGAALPHNKTKVGSTSRWGCFSWLLLSKGGGCSTLILLATHDNVFTSSVHT
jgi:hypothetical protein